MEKISFVIPCYRSEFTIETVVDELETILSCKTEMSYEIVVVNDASPDGVLGVLKKLAHQRSHLKVIDLAKNMGKHAALMAAFSKVSGDIVVCLDDDGQCPVDHLWELLSPLQHDADVTFAKYPRKKQSTSKNFGSAINNWMAIALLNKPKDLMVSNFFAMKRFVCDEILRYQNPYPYIGGLLLRTTSKIKNVDMEERERVSGTTGYTFFKSLSLWMNGFTAFSVKPLRLATFLGCATAAIGFLYAVFLIVEKIMNPNIQAGYSSLMSVILFVGGIIMLLLGLIGEYVGRIYISLNSSPQYVIREMINIEEE